MHIYIVIMITMTQNNLLNKTFLSALHNIHCVVKSIKALYISKLEVHVLSQYISKRWSFFNVWITQWIYSPGRLWYCQCHILRMPWVASYLMMICKSTGVSRKGASSAYKILKVAIYFPPAVCITHKCLYIWCLIVYWDWQLNQRRSDIASTPGAWYHCQLHLARYLIF